LPGSLLEMFRNAEAAIMVDTPVTKLLSI
jgi:hypothetical protein